MHKDGKTTGNNRTRQKYCCPFRLFCSSLDYHLCLRIKSSSTAINA